MNKYKGEITRKFGGKDIFILTARPQASAPAIPVSYTHLRAHET
mgnify:CR=1 FL=1